MTHARKTRKIHARRRMIAYQRSAGDTTNILIDANISVYLRKCIMVYSLDYVYLIRRSIYNFRTYIGWMFLYSILKGTFVKQKMLESSQMNRIQ